MTQEDVKSAKAKGFLLNRGSEFFSGRIVTGNGVVTSAQLRGIADAAEKHGAGEVAFTTRLSIEVPHIPYHTMDGFCTDVAALGLEVGGTGAKVRPVVCCKGTTCIFGRADTQDIATELHRRFYQGWGDVELPHKFKFAVGGCPNSCVKPDLNDFAIVGFRKGSDTQEALYKVYIGGRWGRATRKGDALSAQVNLARALDLAEKALLLFKKEGQPKERFGSMIDRLGIEAVEAILIGDSLFAEKEAILAM